MVEPTENSKPKPMSRKLFEEAVDNAQYLVAYAASKCETSIDGNTIKTLITAKHLIDDNQEEDAEFEAKFWLAYQHIWGLVRPVTAESIKATENKARPTVKRYIIFTVSVLILLLILQIYWVVGNQLTNQLADLLQRETELSQEISANRAEYSAIEIRFKQNEMDSEGFRTSGVYAFYFSPEWERDTLDNLSTKARLETDLASLKSQLERNSAILLVWSNPWKWLIEKSFEGTTSADIDQFGLQIASISRLIDETEKELDADPDGSMKIEEARKQIDDLQKQLKKLETDPEANADQILNLRSQLEGLTNWVNQPGLPAQIISQLNQDLERLKEEKTSLERQQRGNINRETSRQAQLAAQFVLVILQSYLLPLLYGILGAGTSVLRSLSREIDNVTFSEETGIQHLLRISLGALAGIMVGWFSFLLPNETTSFIGSVSPLAIAFLVGYNIELFFSLMDAGINWVNKRRPGTPSSDSSSSTKKEDQTAVSRDDSTSSTT